MFLLISLVSLLDALHPFSAWCERVPAASNPADLPSRAKAGELCHIFQAANCGDICLPAYVLSFLMRDRFDLELAEVIKFESAK